jgi:hypothetical protein
MAASTEATAVGSAAVELATVVAGTAVEVGTVLAPIVVLGAGVVTLGGV